MMTARSVVPRTLVALAIALSWARVAAAEPVAGPEINPFACQGQAEAVESDRTIGQVRDELEKKMDPLFLPSDPPTVRAIKLCVVAELKKRVGDADAIDYYDRAIAQNPDEPGFEMFEGRYYGGARGAKGPVSDLAEKHYYRALAKLNDLRAAGRYREFHAIVEEYVQKGLLTLHQQDGMPLNPWRAYPERPSGRYIPEVAIATQDTVSADTRDGPGGNEAGGFAAEAGLFVLRSPDRKTQPGPAELYEIVRKPLRIKSENQLRLRLPYFGAIDATYSLVKAKDAMITQFNLPAVRNDIDVREVGAAYERTIPLYPLFDLNVRGGIRRVHRVGVVEYLPNCAQDFNVYEAKPSLSRFLSSDKLTLNGTYVFMDIQPIDNCTPTPSPLNVRGRRIAAANVEYAIYSPLVLPQLSLASLRGYRTPTRGLYLSAGYVNDNEVFGDHRAINETYYGGIRLEGPGVFDIGVTESMYVASGTTTDLGGGETPNYDISGRSLRSSLSVGVRIINPDETPGIPGSFAGFAAHSLNLVFPASFDKVLAGRNDFENFRVGTQLWWQMFGTGFGGPAFLVTAGYDYQYFYRIPKHMHNVSVTFRIGWRDL
jgi:hypothetical protein